MIPNRLGLGLGYVLKIFWHNLGGIPRPPDPPELLPNQILIYHMASSSHLSNPKITHCIAYSHCLLFSIQGCIKGILLIIITTIIIIIIMKIMIISIVIVKTHRKVKVKKVSLGWRGTARRTGACGGYEREENESEFGRVNYETEKRIQNEDEDKVKETEEK